MSALPRRSHQKRPPPSTLEHLLIFQAVYELGNTSFASVWTKITNSSLFAQEYCPALSSKDACQKIYNTVMNDSGFDVAAGFPQGQKPKAKEHFQIARRYFSIRVTELRNSIAEEEERFKTLHQEIEEVRTGMWDERIAAEQRESSLNPSQSNSGTVRRGRPTKAEKERRDRVAAVKAAQEEVATTIIGSAHPTSDPAASTADGTDHEDLSQEVDSSLVADQSLEQPTEQSSKETHDVQASSSKILENQSDGEAEKRGEKRKRRDKSVSVEANNTASSRKAEDHAAAEADPAQEEVRESRSSKRARTEDNSPSMTPSAEIDPSARKRFRSSMSQILNQIDLDSASGFFRVPVQPHEAPSYHALIRNPLDLKTIGKRVREGKITSTVEFRRDVLLMLANAIMFNKPDTDVAKDARHLFEVVESLVHVFEASDSFS